MNDNNRSDAKLVDRIEQACGDRSNPQVRIRELEAVIEDFLRSVANARTLVDVNIAAGIAKQELRPCGR